MAHVYYLPIRVWHRKRRPTALHRYRPVNRAMTTTEERCGEPPGETEPSRSVSAIHQLVPGVVSLEYRDGAV